MDCMTIKNAPPKWPEIAEAAKALGAGDWTLRKWLDRCAIPAAMQLKIINFTGGKLTLEDMVIVDTRSREAAE